MVSLKNYNIYELRNYLLESAITSAGTDPIKNSFLKYLSFFSDFEVNPTQFQRCAISGFDITSVLSLAELERLLGCSHFPENTPMQWVSDTWGLLGVKLASEKTGNTKIIEKFNSWILGFLPQRLKDGRLEGNEKAIAEYIAENKVHIPASSAALFLHYKNLIPIEDQFVKEDYISKFLKEFKESYSRQQSFADAIISVYVFDQINKESSVISPKSWRLEDLVEMLENIPNGLRRWTWETKSRTKNSEMIKWKIQNEYHVQNILYVILGAIFRDIVDEICVEKLGQKTPRIDLYLPSLNAIIEIKYKKDDKQKFQKFIDEIGSDVSLYRSDPKYKNCKFISFLWDSAKSTQEHQKFKEGILKISGVDGCVIISSPSFMN